MIRVLIVDDSALVREVLREILDNAKDIEVVGVAANPLIARDKIKQLHPDVLTLDVEMPEMDGIKFLGNLMRLRPMPVVMVSTLTEKGADVTLRALELGAVDYLAKPKSDLKNSLTGYADELLEKIRTAAVSNVSAALSATELPPKVAPVNQVSAAGGTPTAKLIALGSSTGGTEALRQLLSALPAGLPGIVITQHMPAGFTRSFAERMNGNCVITVQEAEDGQPIETGNAYIAPGDRHLRVVGRAGQLSCKLVDTAPVNRHRPSVDVLFSSVVEQVGRKAVAGILTGMGNDGAQGLLELRETGAFTAAQDEKSCVVYGMPRAAVELGAAQQVIPLSRFAKWITDRSFS
ncbi:MAG TPA: chemotaxis response regulator protein-glutamate methylesterase [Gammaproteobacteria bacterium]|nr:chemotaxis response regulator protein-glutamate methylesterase [Gammaproteobacteria bacterium]